MRSRDEVLRDVIGIEVDEEVVYMNPIIDVLADRICELEQERDEDQCVIAVWRGRTERAERIINKIEGMAERAEWKGYDLNPSDVLGALNP